ncbi:TPA: hypothetical protein ACH3X1_016384 [Trebouxia sp. C0004]
MPSVPYLYVFVYTGTGQGSKTNALTYAADADAACILCLVEIGKGIMTPVLTSHLKLRHAGNDIKRYTSLLLIGGDMEHFIRKIMAGILGFVDHMLVKRTNHGSYRRWP